VFVDGSSTIDDSVLNLTVDETDPTTHDLWVAIKGIFRANRESERSIFGFG
jgi:hypothetical protein